MFKDRYDAATKLAAKLGKYKNKNGIILAVPRGGVPLGYEIAKSLDLPLEIILSKKIGHPSNPEYAIGSVTLNGVILDESANIISKEYIKKESERILKTLKEKFKLFMGDHKPTDLKDKTVIIVDDGIATGNTILASVEAIKKSEPKEIIIAVPVAPTLTAEKLAKFVDELICLSTPQDFMGVGQFYENFSQVSDEEVIQFLSKANKIKNVA